MGKEQNRHEAVIKEVLRYINSKTDDFVLKGGTALKQCYDLDRFSEDIDFDSNNKNIEKFINDFCRERGYTYNKKKDTDTVKRFMINYGNDKMPLKVETSYRRKGLDEVGRVNINGIEVYDIDSIAAMKAAAYASRNKIRDLYDVAYICNNYMDQLSDSSRIQLQEVMLGKGLDYFDYLINNQNDPLIDNDKLMEDFLTAWDKIGLNTSMDEKEKFGLEEEKSGNILENMIRDVSDGIKEIGKSVGIIRDDIGR